MAKDARRLSEIANIYIRYAFDDDYTIYSVKAIYREDDAASALIEYCVRRSGHCDVCA